MISESIPDTGPGASMDAINIPMEEEGAGIAEDEDDIDWEEG